MRYILVGTLIIILIVFLINIGVFKNLQSLNFASFFKYTLPTSTYSYIPVSDNVNNKSNNTYLFNSNYSNPNLKDFKKSEISPYAGKIKIERVNISNYEEIILSAYGLQNNEKVNISGWSLVSNKSNFVITFGLKNLDFSKVFKESNILLENGYRVKIYSTYNPIGVNFELNKCIGYLNDFYHFIPKLPEICSKIEKRDIAHLSGVCQEYILKLKTCEIPKQFIVNDNDPRCFNYLKNINYQGCLDKNKNSSDFYLKEWRIFMGREILDNLHDKVILYDNKGLVVDEYIY